MQLNREIEQLEEAMWRHETRGDRAWMDEHLSPGFTEFGQSGRRYTRMEILDMEIGNFTAALPLRDLEFTALGDDCILVTYQSEIDGSRANRSSIWRRHGSSWLMEFHQGTPTQIT